MILRLKNKKEIPVLDSSTPKGFNIKIETLESLQEIVEELTRDNLEQYSFLSTEDQLYGIYPEETEPSSEIDIIRIRPHISGWYVSISLKNRNILMEDVENLKEVTEALIMENLMGGM